MLVGVLVSCGGTDDPDPAVTTTGADNGNSTTAGGNGTTAGGNDNPASGNNTTAGTNGTTASPVAGTKYAKHTAIDFGDGLGNPRAFTFMCRNNRWAYLHGTEDSTSTVTKAAYKRNMKIQEMYNIEIGVIDVQEPGWSSANWHTMLSTSTGEYDIAIPDVWWGVEYGGYFENLMTLPEINVDDEYWVKGWNESMIINNRMYSIVGDAALELYENITVIFYNCDIEDEYNYALYQTVKDGKWTPDEMIYTIDVFNDALIDNDPDNDVYGAQFDQHSLRSSFYCAGIKMLKTNRNNGIISIIANTSRNINAADKVTELLHHTATDNQTGKTARAVSLDNFIQGKLFLYVGCLYRGPQLKAANTVFDYGILIYPKYEESDEYVSTSYGLSTWCIPSTPADTHMVAAVLDTMTWLSNTTDAEGMGEDRLVYTFYDTVCKGQVANSPKDNAMLDMARDLAYYDFSFICNDSMLRGFERAAKDDVSVSTVMESLITTVESELTDIVEFYNK